MIDAATANPISFPTLRQAPPASQTEPAASGATAKTDPDTAKQLEQLKARDREVRAHEAAHLAAAGGFATGGANFHYQKGPDGRNYAVGGEVKIDVSEVSGDPEATLRKAETIRRAALAPAQPSGQDRAVAARAARMANEARIELARQRQGESNPLEQYRQVENSIIEQAAGQISTQA